MFVLFCRVIASARWAAVTDYLSSALVPVPWGGEARAAIFAGSVLRCPAWAAGRARRSTGAEIDSARRRSLSASVPSGLLTDSSRRRYVPAVRARAPTCCAGVCPR